MMVYNLAPMVDYVAKSHTVISHVSFPRKVEDVGHKIARARDIDGNDGSRKVPEIESEPTLLEKMLAMPSWKVYKPVWKA